MSNHSNSASVTSYGSRETSLVKVGGALGIAAVCIALAALVVAIFGFEAALMLSPLALILSAVGMVLSVIGGVRQKHVGDEETQPIAACFVCLAGLVAGALELMFWR
jgi:FtsH-binding integral membrane protein